MTLEKDHLQRLIAAVAEGEVVDWQRESATAAEGEELSLLRALELVAILAAVHRGDEGEPALAPGQHLAFLEIVERIGSGTRGDVYRAFDTRLEREVALKILKPGPHSGAKTHNDPTTHLLEEARRLASVRHPNVVTVYAAEIVDGWGTISMEFVGGETLAQLVRERGRFGAQEVATIGLDLCRALAAVHAAGLVHQDLKAQNAMREEGGRIVLMDFGARSATPLYMAPELFRGEPATVRSDLYSLGVLLYHLATGAFPMPVSHYEDLLRAHREQLAIPLRDARPDLPPPLVQAIEGALAPDPSSRYESAGTMERALTGALGLPLARDPATVELASVPGASGTAHARGIGTRAMLAGALALVTVAIVALVWIRPALRRSPPSVPERERTAGEVPRASKAGSTPDAGAALTFTVEAMFSRGGTKLQPLQNGSSVAVGDSLSLQLRGSDSLYVYVVDEDDRGEAYLLFPLPDLKVHNPLPPNANHVLPGVRGDEQFYWQVTSGGGYEHLLIVASPERLVRFEEDLLALQHAAVDGGRQYVPLNETAKDELRGIGAVVHGPRPSSPAPAVRRSLFEYVEPMTARSETVQGVWIRRIDLRNAS